MSKEQYIVLLEDSLLKNSDYSKGSQLSTYERLRMTRKSVPLCTESSLCLWRFHFFLHERETECIDLLISKPLGKRLTPSVPKSNELPFRGMRVDMPWLPVCQSHGTSKAFLPMFLAWFGQEAASDRTLVYGRGVVSSLSLSDWIVELTWECKAM
jgi:hypothetical protein